MATHTKTAALGRAVFSPAVVSPATTRKRPELLVAELATRARSSRGPCLPLHPKSRSRQPPGKRVEAARNRKRPSCREMRVVLSAVAEILRSFGLFGGL